MISESSFLT